MSSWLTPSENPVGDAAIRSKSASRILQDFLRDNWAYSEIPGGRIGWGYPGTLLGTRSGKSITLRCMSIVETNTKEDTTQRVMRFTEVVRIDIYLRDETAPIRYLMTAKLEGMIRYIQSLIDSSMESFYDSGISGVENVSMSAVPADPQNPNSKIYHAMLTVHAWYRLRNEHPPTI